MAKLVAVDVCCNDPDNGVFDGRARQVQMFGLDIAPATWDGFAFTVDAERRRFRLHRKWFAYQKLKMWVGNWCWDRYWLRRADAKRFIGLLRSSGMWSVEAGPTRLFNWFSAGIPA